MLLENGRRGWIVGIIDWGNLTARKSFDGRGRGASEHDDRLFEEGKFRQQGFQCFPRQ